MRRFVEGIDREQATLFPECLEDWIDQDNPVRAIDAFVDKLDLPGVGFDGVAPEATGRPSYHPSGLLKLYIYGYLNRVQSNTRDKNFTRGKVERRRAQLEKSVARYLAQLDTADLQEPSEELAAKTAHL